MHIMHCAHLIQTPLKQITTSEVEQDATEGIGWSFSPMETVTELAGERGRDAVSEMRESWRTSERKDGERRRWTTRFLGEEGWRGGD